MRQEWKTRFGISKNIYWGHLDGIGKMKKYFYEDANLVECRYEAVGYLVDTDNHSGILIGGDAGIGKTTFIHNITDNYINSSTFHIIFIDADNKPDNPFIYKKLEEDLKSYYKNLFTDSEEKDLVKETNKKYEGVIGASYYDEIRERIHKLLVLYSDVYAKHSTKSNFKHLIIVLDQVEQFSSSDLTSFLSEYVGFLTIAKEITLCVCARKETIRCAKQSVKNYFSTYFRRFVTLERNQIDKILLKRINANRDTYFTQEELFKIFTKTFFDFISNLTNANIRTMLEIFESIMTKYLPYEGRNGYAKYIAHLIEKEFIENLYKKENPSDNIPIYKITFDALQHCGVVNEKFLNVIRRKTFIKGTNIVGLTNTNIENAIKHLCEHDFTIDCFESEKRYEISMKGLAYKNMLTTPIYKKAFCKTTVDEAFIKDVFMDSDFA